MTSPSATSPRAGAFEWWIAEDRVVWSPDLEALYGLSRGTFEGTLDAWQRRTIPADVGPVLAEIDRCVAERREALTYEFRAVLPDGTARWFAGQASFTYDAAGRPTRATGINVDIEDRKRAEARDRFLLALDDRVRPMVDPDAIVAATARMLGEHLGVDRCAYADVEPDQDAANVTGNYARDAAVPSTVGRWTLSAFGARLHAALLAGEPEVADDVEATDLPADQRSAYRAAGVRAAVTVPLMKGDRLVAVMAMHMADAPRAWRADEVELLRRVAGRCWESIERGRLGRELRQIASRLGAALSAGGIATYAWEVESDMIHADVGFAALFDVPHVPVQRRAGAEYLTRIHPDDLPRVQQHLREYLASDATEFRDEYRVVRTDGTTRWVASRGRYERNAATGRAVRMTGAIVDVTERKGNEEAIVASAAHFRLLADALPQLAWIAEPDGSIGWYNRRWYEYTGTTEDAMRGWGWRDVHDPAVLPAVIERWEASITTGQPFEMEFPLRGVDGRFRTFLTRVEPLRDAAGRVTQWFGTNTDVEAKRRELEAEQAARAEAERVARMKDEFLATLSHELRTPLNAIMGWAQLLRLGKLASLEQAKAVETIERNARAQARMVEDLLDMNRIISGKVRLDVQRVDLADVVENAVESLRPAAAARGVRIERILDPIAGPVSGDPGRLQQIVWNLLSNAIKFTPAGGKAQVVLERVNSHLEIGVSDTGVGIRPDFLPFVFDRFRQADASTTRAFGGLGLGLSIVKQLAELHGGSVRAKSPGEGGGATFTVALPLAAAAGHGPDDARVHPNAARDARDEEDDANPPSLEGLTALVVDDEADARTLVRRLLEERGARVLTAANVDEALALIEGGRPDVLLSDIGMPDADGYELVRRTRALGTNRGGMLPAVALTAFARSEDRRRALLAGFQSHVSKPVDAAELIAVVASLTGRTG